MVTPALRAELLCGTFAAIVASDALSAFCGVWSRIWCKAWDTSSASATGAPHFHGWQAPAVANIAVGVIVGDAIGFAVRSRSRSCWTAPAAAHRIGSGSHPGTARMLNHLM